MTEQTQTRETVAQLSSILGPAPDRDELTDAELGPFSVAFPTGGANSRAGRFRQLPRLGNGEHLLLNQASQLSFQSVHVHILPCGSNYSDRYEGDGRAPPFLGAGTRAASRCRRPRCCHSRHGDLCVDIGCTGDRLRLARGARPRLLAPDQCCRFRSWAHRAGVLLESAATSPQRMI